MPERQRRGFEPLYQVVADDVKLGRGVRLSSFVNLYGCEIGDEATIGAFVEVQAGAVIGARCKIGSHTFICSGVTIGEGSFVGHGVMFVNDNLPRAVSDAGEVLGDGDWEMVTTTIGRKVSIGTGSTILGGLSIGDRSVVGAGSVVTRNVPSGTKVYGVPARMVGDA